MRKLPTQQRLKELVVRNFLNVYSALLILVLLSLAAIAVLFHFYTINKNSTASEEEIQKSPEDSGKHLFVIAMIETMCQSFSFLTNPALR